MFETIKKHPGAVFAAILVHIAIALVVLMGLHFKKTPEPVGNPVPVSIVSSVNQFPRQTDINLPDIAKTLQQHELELKALERQKSKEQALDVRKKTQKIEPMPLKQVDSRKLQEEKAKKAREITKRIAKEKARKKARAKKKVREKAAKRAREKAKKKARERKKKKAAAKKAAKEKRKAAKEKAAKEKAAKEKAKKEREKKQAALAAAAKAKHEAEKKAEAAAKRKAEEAARVAAAKKAQKAKAQQLAQKRAKALGNWGRKIVRHVRPRWQTPPGSSGMTAKVRVKVSRSGYIRHLTVVSCKGSTSFCNSIKEAFKRAEPLPSPSRNDLFDENLNLTFRR